MASSNVGFPQNRTAATGKFVRVNSRYCQITGYSADEKTAQLRLRAELAVLVETRGATKEGTVEEIDLRSYLASSSGLPALFGDDVFRSRLLAEEGPIARLVREKLAGKGPEDKDDAFGFTAENLNLSVDDVNKAGGLVGRDRLVGQQ